MTKRTVSPTISVRVSPALYKAFKGKSTKYGGVSEVIRVMMTAFTEDRLTIKAPEITKESIYSLPSTN